MKYFILLISLFFCTAAYADVGQYDHNDQMFSYATLDIVHGNLAAPDMVSQVNACQACHHPGTYRSLFKESEFKVITHTKLPVPPDK